MPEHAYTLKEVAQIAGLSVRTLRDYVHSKRLKAVQIGNGKTKGRNEWRVSRDEIYRVFGIK